MENELGAIPGLGGRLGSLQPSLAHRLRASSFACATLVGLAGAAASCSLHPQPFPRVDQHADGSDKATRVGGSTSAGGAGTGPHDVSTACNAFAKAYCARWTTCAPWALHVTWGDAGTCVSRTAKGCAEQATAADMTPPALTQACASALRAAACDDLLNDELPRQCIPDGGPRADGASCGADAQCKSTFCDHPRGAYPQTGGCGKCAPPPKAGDTCPAQQFCGSGLTCDVRTRRCAPYAQAGDRCTEPRDCSEHFLLTCTANQCSPTKGGGERCAHAEDCNLLAGFACDLASMTCKTIQTAVVGEPCGKLEDGDDYSFCIGGSYCPISHEPHTRCKPRIADGASCAMTSTDLLPGCLSPADCIKAICAIPDASCM